MSEMINIPDMRDALNLVEEKHGAVLFDVNVEEQTIRPQQLIARTRGLKPFALAREIQPVQEVTI